MTFLMIGQSLCGMEDFVTFYTSKTVRFMKRLMFFKCRRGHKTVHTFVTRERCFARDPMVLQRLAAHKHLRAHITLVHDAFLVYDRMFFEFSLGNELFAALLTRVLRNVIVVQTSMFLVHVERVKNLTTFGTRIFTGTRMSISHMTNQITFLIENIVTGITFVDASFFRRFSAKIFRINMLSRLHMSHLHGTVDGTVFIQTEQFTEFLTTIQNRTFKLFHSIRFAVSRCLVSSTFVLLNLMHGSFVCSTKCIWALITWV